MAMLEAGSASVTCSSTNLRQRVRLLWGTRKGCLLKVCLFLLVTGVACKLAYQLSLSHAEHLILTHRNEDAKAWLSALERVSSSSAETQLLLARLAWSTDDVDEVRQHLVAAKSLGCPDAQIEFEETLILASEGRLRQMDRALQRLLVTREHDLQRVCDAFVSGYLRQFRFVEARALNDVWRQDYPGDSQPWFHEGCICQFEMRPVDASASFKKALALAPYRTVVRARLAAVLVQNLQYSEAIQHYDLLLKEQPDNVEWLVGFGICHFNEGDLSEARQAFLNALTVSPKHREGRLAIAELEANEGRFDEALRFAIGLCDDYPADYSSRYLMVRMLRSLGRHEDAQSHVKWLHEAEQVFREVSELRDKVNRQPEDVSARVEIAKRLNRYSKHSEAVGWLRAALHLEPDNQLALKLLDESCRLAGIEGSVVRDSSN